LIHFLVEFDKLNKINKKIETENDIHQIIY